MAINAVLDPLTGVIAQTVQKGLVHANLGILKLYLWNGRFARQGPHFLIELLITTITAHYDVLGLDKFRTGLRDPALGPAAEYAEGPLQRQRGMRNFAALQPAIHTTLVNQKHIRIYLHQLVP